MAASPDDRRYSKEHEWVLMEGESALVGITDYAQEQLGDIVYVQLPDTGTAVKQFEKMGEIESVKAVSDLYTPATGEVLQVNEALAERPELANSAPYGEGWLVRLRLTDPAELESLLSGRDYDALIVSEQKDEAIGP